MVNSESRVTKKKSFSSFQIAFVWCMDFAQAADENGLWFSPMAWRRSSVMLVGWDIIVK
jgi:putative exporter of polyketide antibiotics